MIFQLRPWIRTWANPELFGGLPERDARLLHLLLHADLEDAEQLEEVVIGMKLDLQKAFDSIAPNMAIRDGAVAEEVLCASQTHLHCRGCCI